MFTNGYVDGIVTKPKIKKLRCEVHSAKHRLKTIRAHLRKRDF